MIGRKNLVGRHLAGQSPAHKRKTLSRPCLPILKLPFVQVLQSSCYPPQPAVTIAFSRDLFTLHRAIQLAVPLFAQAFLLLWPVAVVCERRETTRGEI